MQKRACLRRHALLTSGEYREKAKLSLLCE